MKTFQHKKEPRRQKGEFQKTREKNRKRQRLFDKIKRLREGEEVWLSAPYQSRRIRVKVSPFSEKDVFLDYGFLLVQHKDRIFITGGYIKDGKVSDGCDTWYISQLKILGSVSLANRNVK